MKPKYRKNQIVVIKTSIKINDGSNENMFYVNQYCYKQRGKIVRIDDIIDIENKYPTVYQLKDLDNNKLKCGWEEKWLRLPTKEERKKLLAEII